jgi:two-component system, LytTR family, response regulator LytT
MKYLLIEDEAPAQRLMIELLKELRPGWETAACLDSVENSIDWLNSHPHPDVIFMDIQLSDGLCFDILDQVKIDSLIIFTTAYDEYAIRAFKVNSIDYLLKPIKKSELEAALQKYERFTKEMFQNWNTSIDTSELALAITKAIPKYRSRFLVSVGEMFFPLPVTDVAYIYSQFRITSAVNFAGKRHVIDFTLDRLEEELNPDMFFRANRQFIINIKAAAKVHTFFNGKLLLETLPAFEEKITIGREKARQFKSWLDR